MRKNYSTILLEHYNNPQNVGELDKTDPDVGTGTSGTAACGDVLRLQILVKNEVIEDAKFKTFGCGSAIASSSLLTQLIKGKRLEDIGDVKNSDIAEVLSLPKIKLHCSVLAEEALSAAVDDYRQKHGQTVKQCYSEKVNNNRQEMTAETPLTLTEAAKDRMMSMLKTQKGKCVVVGVRHGGCKGLTYDIEVCQDIPDGMLFSCGELKVSIPADALPLIAGSIVDYVDSGVRAGFKFDNPNQSGCCGCGMSFCA
jgi:nitrogen fixation NifU-like protein